MPTFSALTESTLIEVRGAEAAAFLNAQLSRGVVPGALEHAPLAGWLDARGRVRALLRVWQEQDRWLLETPRDGVDELLKRLRMFVLRSAVTLRIADDLALGAVLDPAPDWLAARGLSAATEPGTVITQGTARWLCIAPGYWQLLGPGAAVADVARELPRAPAGAAASAEIRLGLPAIVPPLVDKFVAQMLNLDLLGATIFDKGCYPGQEIVARVHNLGDVKRRARRYAASSAPPGIGATVNAPGGEAVGEVVRSAESSSGCELLAVVDHAAADGPLAIAGAALRELPLPFAIRKR
jgi:folate-binding protein YgfZ